MALTGTEQRELEDLESKDRIFHTLTDAERQRMKALRAKSGSGQRSEDTQRVYNVGPTAEADFLKWAAEHNLTGADFGAEPAPGRFLQWAFAHNLTGEDFGKPAAGGAAGGGAPAGGGGAGAPPAMTDEQIRARIDELGFGWLATDPQVGPLLIELASGRIDQTTFNGRLRQTKWWKTHGESVRQWDTLAATDPATAKARQAGMVAQITNQAMALGLADPSTIYSISMRALRFSLNAEQIQDMLAREVDFNKARFGAASALQGVRQMEHDFVTPLSKQTRERMARQLIAGDVDPDSLRGQFVAYARSAFANNDDVVDALDRGLTVRDFASPYMELAARELGINPNSIDLLDRKWRRALHSRTPEGKPGAMSLDEWGSTLRTDDTYGWQYTDQANEMLSGDILAGAS